MGTARLEQAEDAFRTALRERIRERTPLGWAMTQSKLAEVVAEIGTRTGAPARWREALGLAEAALGVCEAAGASHYAARARERCNAIRAMLMDGAHP